MSASAAPPPRTNGLWSLGNKYSRVTFTVSLVDGADWADYDLELLRGFVNPDYMIIGKETATTTGRKHFQGYMEFSKRKQAKTIDKNFRKVFPLPHSVHFESSRGTAEENIKYCSKEDTQPFVFGEVTGNNGQGSRTDLQGVYELVKKGATMEEVADNHFALFCQYHKGIQMAINMKQKRRDWPTQLIFLWGKTGTGKSMHAQELKPEAVIYTKGDFFIGYSGTNEVVLFDDFDWNKMDYRMWLNICDRYPMVVNVKGGERNWCPKIIIFTSNDDPKTWWQGIAPLASLEAIHRRMDDFGEIRHFESLIPKSENILEKFFSRATGLASLDPEGASQARVPAASVESRVTRDTPSGAPSNLDSPAAPATSDTPAPTQPLPQIIDLTGDTDEEVVSLTSGRVHFSSKKRTYPDPPKTEDSTAAPGGNESPSSFQDDPDLSETEAYHRWVDHYRDRLRHRQLRRRTSESAPAPQEDELL